MLKCFNYTTSSISYVARFVLVAMRCNPFRTIVNTARNNKNINIPIPIASGKILIASINAAGVKTSIQPIIFLSFIYSPPTSLISSSTVHSKISATFLIFLTVGLIPFPHLQMLPVETFASSSNLLIEMPRSFARLRMLS